MGTNNRLAKCPFCGGDAWIDYDMDKKTVWVECKECGAKSRTAKISEEPTFRNIDEASAYVMGAWERRADE